MLNIVTLISNMETRMKHIKLQSNRYLNKTFELIDFTVLIYIETHLIHYRKMIRNYFKMI